MEQPSKLAEAASIEQLVTAWKTLPTILASSSQYRLHELRDVGFVKAELAGPIPARLESDVAEKLLQHGLPPNHYDSDGREYAKYIAAQKVQFVLEHLSPPNAVVIGFDTIPIIFDSATDTKPLGNPKSTEKFKTIEAARQGILEQFTLLAHGTQELATKTEKIMHLARENGWDEETLSVTLQVTETGFRRGKIYVQTGVAISTPEDRSVVGLWSEDVQLISDAILETGGNEQALEKLVDLIIQTQGEYTLTISGGVDYADSYVRDILKIREVTLADEPTDERLYRGFSAKALDTVLHQHARRFLQS